MGKKLPLCIAMFLVLVLASVFPPTFPMAIKDREGNLEARATLVVVGRAKAVESRWNGEKTLIYSYVTVTVENPLKGTVTSNEVVVRHLGGEVGSIGQWTENEPSFTMGERVKLYLKQDKDGVYTVVGGHEGKRSLDAKEVTSPGYSWKGWYWPQVSLPVVYYVNPTLAPLGALEAVKRAFQTWEDDPGSYMDYTYAGSTEKTGPINDGYNVVSWGYIDGPGGAPATAGLWFKTMTNEIIEFDIKFDSSDSWQVWEDSAASYSFDIQNFATHEAGHSLGLLGLDDLAEQRETMCSYFIPISETTKRTLYTGDLLGLSKIYPATCNVGVTVWTDKVVYKPGWSVQVSPRIIAKAGGTIDFFWCIFFAGQIYPILYAPGVSLPPDFDAVFDFDVVVPNLGPTGCTAAWLVAILSPATGEILAWHFSLWSYIPAPSTGPVVAPGDFAAQIVRRTSLPF